MNSRNYAAIDCGTNSTRLLIGNKFETLDRQMKITQLGQDLDKSGELSSKAMKHVLDVLKDFRSSLDTHEVSEVRMVATSAARDASNSEDFFNQVESTIGVRPELLTGEEEGRLAFEGAIAELKPFEGPFLILDMVVASILLSMGMMMLPPVLISLPFKLMLFVMVDGWYLTVGSLMRSFGV